MSQDPIDPKLAPVVEFFEQGVAFNKHLALRVEGLREGWAVARIPWADELLGDPTRPAVHGGVISSLADATGGVACLSMLGPSGDRLSTVDLRVDYLRPGPAKDLVCEARVVRMGNRVAVVKMEVFAGELPAERGPEERPIATAQAVYNVSRRGERG